MDKLVELASNIELGNVFQVLIICVWIVILMTKNASYFFSSEMELLVSKRKATEIRDIMTAIALYTVLGVTNYVLALEDKYVIIEFVTLLIIGIGYLYLCWRTKENHWAWIDKIICKFKTKNLDKKKENCQMTAIIIEFPILILIIKIGTEIDLWIIVLIVTIAEVALLQLQNNGFRPDKPLVMVQSSDGSREFYVYRKIDDDYLLCGDNQDINRAKMVRMLEIEKIKQGEYFLHRNAIDK